MLYLRWRVRPLIPRGDSMKGKPGRSFPTAVAKLTSIAKGDAREEPQPHPSNGKPSRSTSPKAQPASVHRYPAHMPMGQFLFDYLHRAGVRHSFGVPGDFALPTFAWLDKSPIQSIAMTHEPGAGFAADAYSRIN